MSKFIFFLLINIYCFTFSIVSLWGVRYIPSALFNIYICLIFISILLFFILTYYLYNKLYYGKRDIIYAFINGLLFTPFYVFIYFTVLFLFSIEKFFMGRITCEDYRFLKYCSTPTWFEDYAGTLFVVVLSFLLIDVLFITIFFLTKKYNLSKMIYKNS